MPRSLKLCNLVVCLNIWVEFDQQRLVNFWFKVKKGSKVKLCECDNIKSMRPRSFKLCNLVICLNIWVAFDQQHPVTFGGPVNKGSR